MASRKLENAPPVVKENDQLLGLSVKAPEKPSHKLKEIGYEEISQIIYKRQLNINVFDPQLYDDYYNTFLNQKIISVKYKNRQGGLCFTGEDRTGDPTGSGTIKFSLPLTVAPLVWFIFS